jgi:hypothetical protein
VTAPATTTGRATGALASPNGYVTTHLELTTRGTTQEASFSKQAVTASLERRVGDRWTVGGALGSTLVGSLQPPGSSFALSPGPLLTLSGSFRALDEGKVAPFLLFTASLGAAVSWTTPTDSSGGPAQSFWAFDGRIGVAAGKTIAHVVTPYALARAFGLPVLWHNQGASTEGTDAYHYQLGAGVVVRIGAFDLDVEGVPLGEKAVVGGVGYAF